MQPVPVGSRIRVVGNEHNHSYSVGCVYTVVQVDSDGTFRAADDNGRAGNWLRWGECEPAGITTWSRIAADLPDPLVRFLACFEGISDICINEKIVDAVLSRLPDLHERIVAAAATPTGERATSMNHPRSGEPQQDTP